MVSIVFLLALVLLVTFWVAAYSDRMQRRGEAKQKERWKQFRTRALKSHDAEEV